MKINKCLSILCLTFLTQGARSELISSRLDLGNNLIFAASASAGPVADKRSVTQGGQVISGQTVTAGLLLAALPQYSSAGPFLVTNVFTSRAAATQSVPLGPPPRGAVSSLMRSGFWTFKALRSDLDGTNGSARFTFKYSWAQRVQGADSASLSLGLVFDDDLGDDSFSRTLAGNGGLVSSSGTAFWTPSVTRPIQFGTDFGVSWTLSTDSSVSNGPGWECIAKASAEIWDVEVFDSFGTRLVRFIDYDWIESVGPQSIPYPVATGVMLPSPVFASITRAPNGDALVDFFGTLEQSADLLTWAQIDPTLIGPYRIVQPLPGRQFFRSRQP